MDPRIGVIYRMEFNPSRYLAANFAGIDTGDHRWYHIIKEEISRVPEDNTDRKLIDVGCGPSVMTALLASGKYSEIHLCDYSPLNTGAIRSWLNGEAGCHDWSKYADHIGNSEGIKAEMVAERTKVNITKVFECDVISKEGLAGCEKGCFDMVTCMGVLSAASSTIDNLHLGVKNLFDVLNPGGCVLIGNVFGLSSYFEGPLEFPNLNHTEKDMANALVSGFVDITMKETPSENMKLVYGEFDIPPLRMFITGRKPLDIAPMEHGPVQ